MQKITGLMAILFFTLLIGTAAQAAPLRCTVINVLDTVVTMECGDKAATLKAGTKLKVKTSKGAPAAIEGC